MFNFEEGTDHLGFANGATVVDSFVDGVFFSGSGGGIRGATGQSITGYTGTFDLIIPDTAAFTTWDGGDIDDSNWTSGDNWVGDAAPTSGNTLRIAFGGSTRLTPDMDTNFTVNDLRFNSGASSFTLGSTGANTLTFGGNVPSIIQASANNQTINSKINLSTTTVFETSGSGELTLGGVVSGSGGIIKLVSSTLNLTADNTYTGQTTIGKGTVNIQHDNALGATSGSTTVIPGATLELEGGISVGAEALKLSGTLTDVSGDNSWAGVISDSGTITKAGAGTLTLSGSSGNTFTGTTNVNTGILSLNKSSGNALGGTINIGDGTGTDTVRLQASNQIADSSTVTMNAAGTPTLDLNSFNDTIGSLAGANASASVSLGSGTLTTGDSTNTTFSGVVSGTGGLTKQGSGTFTVSGANTYSGATSVNAGTLNIQNATALGTTAAGTTVASGATLQLQGGITVGAESLTLNGTLTDVSGDNTFGGAISGTGVITKAGSGTLTLSGSGANTYTGTTTVNAGILDLNKTAGTNAIGGALTIGDGTGTVRLQAANQISDSSAVTMTAGGTPTLNLNSFNETIGSLASANASASVSLGSGTLTTGDSNDTTFTGVISGTGGLTKQG